MKNNRDFQSFTWKSILIIGTFYNDFYYKDKQTKSGEIISFIFSGTDQDPNEHASSMVRRCGYQSTKTWCVHAGKRWGNFGAGMEVVNLTSSHPCLALGRRIPLLRRMGATIWTQHSRPPLALARRIEVRRAAGRIPTPRPSPLIPPTIRGNLETSRMFKKRTKASRTPHFQDCRWSQCCSDLSRSYHWDYSISELRSILVNSSRRHIVVLKCAKMSF